MEAMGKKELVLQGRSEYAIFHAWTNQRRRSNAISSIKDLSGAVWSDQSGIGSAFTTYFEQLFTFEGAPGLEECILTVTP
jgi:hypothetical protein